MAVVIKWKQFKCPSTDKCINKKMEYYPAIKKNEVFIHVTWMNLENIIMWKKQDTKGHIEYDDFILMKSLEGTSLYQEKVD